MDRIKFRDAPIGSTFYFDPGVYTFSRLCTKISARRYQYLNAHSQIIVRIGSINTTVKLIEPKDYRQRYVVANK